MVRHNQPRHCDHAWKEIGGRVEADPNNWLIRCIKCGKVEPFFDTGNKVTEISNIKDKYDDREVEL